MDLKVNKVADHKKGVRSAIIALVVDRRIILRRRLAALKDIRSYVDREIAELEGVK